MLATYFKQYPPHLAKIAKRQAESRSLPPASPQPPFMMDESPPEETDSGRTYTISEQSDERFIVNKKEKENSPDRDRKIQKSQSLELKGKQSTNKDKCGPLAFDLHERKSKDPFIFNLKDKRSPAEKDGGPFSLDFKTEPKLSPIKDGPASLDINNQKPSATKNRPQTLDLKDKRTAQVLSRSNRLSPRDGPQSFDRKSPHHSPTKDYPSLSLLDTSKKESKSAKKSPVKDRSPLSELFKSKTISDASFAGRKSPPKDSKIIAKKSTTERKVPERSISLDEGGGSKSRRRDPPRPLKKLPKEEEEASYEDHHDTCKLLHASPEGNVDEDSPSSDEECFSTPVVKMVKGSSPPTKPKSVTKPISEDHHHQNNGGSSCPLHGTKSHSPPQPRVRISSSSSSSRSSAAENQLLHCGMCAQRFSNPKVLPCLHTFCESCLISYTPDESLTLTCPLCRQQSILPKDGVTGLQANTWVNGIIEALDNPPQLARLEEPCSSCSHKSTMSCVQCDIFLCENCAHQHSQDSTTSDEHSVISLDDALSQTSSEQHAQEDTTLYCSSHAGQTLRFYCCNCETAVCTSCTAIEHQTHTTMRLIDVVDDQKMSLHRLIEKVTAQLPCVKEALCDLTDISTRLDLKKRDAENQIRVSFQTLHDVLSRRQIELMNTLNNVVSVKKNSVEDQRVELEEWIEGVESGCECVEKTLNNCPAMEVVLVKKQLGEKLGHYAESEFPPVPKENAHIQFIPGNVDPLRNTFKNIGNIQTNNAVPQQTTAVSSSLKSTVIGRQILVTVVTRDHKGGRVKTGGAQVSATVSKCKESQHNGHTSGGEEHTDESCPYARRRNGSQDFVIEPRVIDLKNGNYEITFSFHREGFYKLSLMLFGQHINASPFTIHAQANDTESSDQGSAKNSYKRQTSRSTQVTRTSKNSRSKAPSYKSSCSIKTNPLEDDLIFKVGTRGRGRGEFVNPQGICYAPIKDGRIVLADSNNQCVQVFTMNGDCKVKFGSRGRNAGQMQRPTGVAALPSGNYAVADYENRWISVFEPTGKYVTRIGNGKLLGPKGLCVNAQGNLIVVDNKASCVCIFSPAGKLLTKFGNRVMEGYNFAGPHFCATNSRGDIVITDFHNHCVRVFDSEGVALFTFGKSGEGNGQFNAPTGVAIDLNDNIIVADWGNSRIQIFDSQGSFLTFINTQVDPLYGPQGLSLTADGNVLVADSGNHCFKMYKYLQ